MSFAHVEAAVIAFLQDKGATSVSGYGPNDKSSTLPHTQVTRVTGRDDRYTDRPVIDLDHFAARREQAANQARTVHDWMPDLIGAEVTYTDDDGQPVTVQIDDVRTDEGPHREDFGDPNVERYVASYYVDSRLDAQS
jgi:hypothetical protein